MVTTNCPCGYADCTGVGIFHDGAMEGFLYYGDCERERKAIIFGKRPSDEEVQAHSRECLPTNCPNPSDWLRGYLA